jgi:hypothetical protein
MTTFLGADAYRATVRHRVARIQAEVHEDALDLARVGEDRPGIWCEIRLDGDGVPDDAPQRLDEPLHLPIHIDRLRPQHLLTTEREQLLRQFAGASRRVLNLLDVSVSDGLGSGMSRARNVAQLVMTVSRLLKSCATPPRSAHRLHLLRLLEPPLELSLPGEIFRDAVDADDLAVDDNGELRDGDLYAATALGARWPRRSSSPSHGWP